MFAFLGLMLRLSPAFFWLKFLAEQFAVVNAYLCEIKEVDLKPCSITLDLRLNLVCLVLLIVNIPIMTNIRTTAVARPRGGV